MTVIPFRSRSATSQTGAGPALATAVAVTGSFSSPSGRAGTFTGCYRLERFVARAGQMAAAGVFTGELTDADGTRIGVGSRRQTAAVDIAPYGPSLVVRLGPLDVNLLGFSVSVPAMGMQIPAPPVERPAGRPALRLVEDLPDADDPPSSVTELMRTVVAAAALGSRDDLVSGREG